MCNCKKNRASGGSAFTVKLPGGLKVTKNSEAEAKAFAAKHPGATVSKAAA